MILLWIILGLISAWLLNKTLEVSKTTKKNYQLARAVWLKALSPERRQAMRDAKKLHSKACTADLLAFAALTFCLIKIMVLVKLYFHL